MVSCYLGRLRREVKKKLSKSFRKKFKTTLDIDEMYERKYKELMEDDDNMINKEKISIDSIKGQPLEAPVRVDVCMHNNKRAGLLVKYRCGKTTVCQLLSMTSGIPLTILNCINTRKRLIW